ncbi:UNVERIFIED_CONTAM: hypothetical protein FKN15_030596 [Acipenser sinensis]
MASHVTTAGGFAIVTHAYPLNSAGQAAPGTVASQLPGSMQTFLRGEPKALGVKACLGMNIVSSIFAGVGFILYSINLYINNINRSSGYYLTNPHVGILSVLLVLNILEMCIAIATSAFGCKSECCYTAMEIINRGNPTSTHLCSWLTPPEGAQPLFNCAHGSLHQREPNLGNRDILQAKPVSVWSSRSSIERGEVR